MSRYGSQSMVLPLRRVLVRPPDAAFGDAEPERWGYTTSPRLSVAREEHAAFVALLEESGAEVLSQREGCGSADSIFTHDPSLVTRAGAVILNMGKPLRAEEPQAVAAEYARLGIPLLGQLSGDERAEGGDLLWLDDTTLAAGMGFRTNAAGVERLRTLLQPLKVSVLPFHLPYWDGRASCLHLMSFISLLDHDLAVVHRRLMPVPLWQLLDERGIRSIDVATSEFAGMAPNVLAVKPRDVVMLEGTPRTAEALRAAGCRVRTYRGEEISLKAEGGATCLTRPILRCRD